MNIEFSEKFRKNKKVKEKLQEINSKLSIQIGQLSKTDPLSREIFNNHVILRGVEEYYDMSEIYHWSS